MVFAAKQNPEYHALEDLYSRLRDANSRHLQCISATRDRKETQLKLELKMVEQGIARACIFDAINRAMSSIVAVYDAAAGAAATTDDAREIHPSPSLVLLTVVDSRETTSSLD